MKYEEMIKLKRYCQFITEHPRPMSEQNAVYGLDRSLLYCDDWHIIELLKCMFHGGDVYLGDPPPRRLRNNPKFDQYVILNEATQIMSDHKYNVDSVIEYLQKKRGA